MRAIKIKGVSYIVGDLKNTPEKVNLEKFLPKGSILYFKSNDCLFSLLEEYYPDDEFVQVEPGSIYNLRYGHIVNGLFDDKTRKERISDALFIDECFYPSEDNLVEYLRSNYGI